MLCLKMILLCLAWHFVSWEINIFFLVYCLIRRTYSEYSIYLFLNWITVSLIYYALLEYDLVMPKISWCVMGSERYLSCLLYCLLSRSYSPYLKVFILNGITASLIFYALSEMDLVKPYMAFSVIGNKHCLSCFMYCL